MMQNRRSMSQTGWLCASAIIVMALGSCTNLHPATRDRLVSEFDALRSTAQAVIVDAERRDEYLGYVGEMESEFESLGAFGADFLPRFRAAFTSYDTGDEPLARLMEEFHVRQNAARAKLLDLHLAMAATVDATEFKPLSARERKIYETLRKAAGEPGV